MMNYRVVLVSLIHRESFIENSGQIVRQSPEFSKGRFLETKGIINRIVHREILLVKRKRNPGIGLWSLPGGIGALETEKDPFKAVIMEAYSDFGVEFRPDFYTLRFSLEKEPTLYLYYHGEIAGEPKVQRDSKTIKEIKWLSIKEVLNINLAFEEDKPIIQKFKEYIERKVKNETKE